MNNAGLAILEHENMVTAMVEICSKADGALVHLGEISAASVAGTWSRLKVCRNDACRWAYYDASRNHSRIWCSMAICGNRAKGRALRVRRRDGTVAG